MFWQYDMQIGPPESVPSDLGLFFVLLGPVTHSKYAKLIRLCVGMCCFVFKKKLHRESHEGTSKQQKKMSAEDFI